jgi:hypothetical protein
MSVTGAGRAAQRPTMANNGQPTVWTDMGWRAVFPAPEQAASIGSRRHVDRPAVTGFAGVMALVLAEFVAGSAAFTWLTPLWRETKRSYFSIFGSILTVMALAAWWSARTGVIPGDEAGTWSLRLTLATLIVIAASVTALIARRERVGRALGVASVPLAIAAVAAMAPTGRQPTAVSMFQLLAGAAFLGSVFDGLFLGHWYLTDRKLTRTPIKRITMIAILATIVEMVAVATGGFSGTTPTSTSFNPLLTAGALAPWIALGSVLTTLVIVVLVKVTLRGERASGVQSATGFYYLGVVTAFTAEIAVKARFFPG